MWVSYAGVNPVDWKIREGYLEKLFLHAFPLIPGWDMSGVIEAVGNSVTEFKPGNKVDSHIQPKPIKFGTYAEFTPADASAVFLTPSNLGFAEAASIPLAIHHNLWTTGYFTTLDSLGSEFGINAGLVFVTPNGKTLQELTSLIETGHLKSLPIEEYSLDEAKAAQIKSAEGHLRGKLVLRIQ